MILKKDCFVKSSSFFSLLPSFAKPVRLHGYTFYFLMLQFYPNKSAKGGFYNKARNRQGSVLTNRESVRGAHMVTLKKIRGFNMKKLIRVALSAFVLFMLSACVSSEPAAQTAAKTKTQTPPAWFVNTSNVYPEKEYITGRGQGTTKAEAESKARTELAYFFNTQVNAEMSSRQSFTTGKDGVTNEERQTQINNIISTQGQLRAVRLAEDAWLDPKTRLWSTVAYIKRDEGWTVYESDFKKQSETLLAIVQKADKESDPFNAYLRYGNAIAYSNSVEYTAARLFASVLNSTKANNLFADVDAATASLPQKQLDAREKSRMYVENPVDYNNMIYQAAVKALGNAGFSVERNRNNALTYCLISVEEGEQKTDAGFFYTPVLTGIISGKNGSLFSFKIEASRQGAANQDNAKRRAYTALSEAFENAFTTELAKYQNTLVNK